VKVNLTFKTILAFLAFLFVCQELHEISHTVVARWQCGCWGNRNFSVWQACSNCPADINPLWPCLAGPLLTYLIIWLGFFFMSKPGIPQYQSLGWVLVFANTPFARLFTVLMKKGDESVVTRVITGEPLTAVTWLIEIAVVLLLIVPPLIKAWKMIFHPNRMVVFLAFLLAPMLIEFALLHQVGGKLLQRGILNKTGVLGSPLLVNLWSFLWFSGIMLFGRSSGKCLYPVAPDTVNTKTQPVKIMHR